MTTNPYQSSKSAESPRTISPPVQEAVTWKLARSVLGIVAGVVIGGIVVALIEIPGWMLHPVPAGVDLNDAEALTAHASKAPFSAQLVVAIAWLAGPLVGSFLAAAISRWAYFAHGMIIASVFLAFVVMTLRAFPHPTWMVLVGVLVPLASGWIGSAAAEWLVSPRTLDPRPDPKRYDMRRKNMAC